MHLLAELGPETVYSTMILCDVAILCSARGGSIHPGLHCRKDRDTLRLTQSIINNVSEAGPLPFELRVLEALLDETARQFERRQRRLELLAMSIEEDIQKTLKQNGADLQRLLPIQRCRARSPLPC